MAFPVSSATIWIDRLSFMTAIINGVILLIILITQLYKRMSKQKIACNIKIFNLFAILTIFCGTTFCIQKIFASFGIFSDSDYHCELHVELGALFWLSMKHSMYICFIIRLHFAFKDSMFEFSHKIFIFLYTTIIISYITQLLIYILFGDGKLHIDYDHHNKIPYCISVCPFWTRMYNILCDFTLMILLCVLFVKRLFKAFILSQQHQSINNSFVQCEIAKIAQYITLSITGVITTFLALICFGITSWFVWISIDIIINCWCILLMFRINRNLFDKICCLCHKCVGYSFYKILECNGNFAYIVGNDASKKSCDYSEETRNTSASFKTHSLNHKEIAILTRASFCRIYRLECEHNVNTVDLTQMMSDDGCDGDGMENTQTVTDEMLMNGALNLPHPELIAVPSRSDTLPTNPGMTNMTSSSSSSSSTSNRGVENVIGIMVPCNE